LGDVTIADFDWVSPKRSAEQRCHRPVVEDSVESVVAGVPQFNAGAGD
jgi:hypothetical protein